MPLLPVQIEVGENLFRFLDKQMREGKKWIVYGLDSPVTGQQDIQ